MVIDEVEKAKKLVKRVNEVRKAIRRVNEEEHFVKTLLVETLSYKL